MTDDISMKALKGSLAANARAADRCGLRCGAALQWHARRTHRRVGRFRGASRQWVRPRAERALAARRKPDEVDIPALEAKLDALITGAVMVEDDFEEGQARVVPVAERVAAEALIVDIDGFEGPLDVLLTLGRTQKVDLRKVSILELARQYLAFVDQAKQLRIELAADYLVMAAWLAFLKSRLLLPPDPAEDGPSGEEMAAHLAFQLERLQAMREHAAMLMARDQLGRDFFARGIPEDVTRVKRVTYTATLLDLMQGYARIRTKDEFRPYAMDRESVFTMEQALERMRSLIGFAGTWTDISTYLPEGFTSDPPASARRRHRHSRPPWSWPRKARSSCANPIHSLR